jgi:hypothetical protein
MSHDYTEVFASGLLTVPGVLAMVLFITSVVSLKYFRDSKVPIAGISFLVAVAFGCISFYSGVYVFPEDADAVATTIEQDEQFNCGTAWTGWTKSGYGIATPCPAGCYSGLTASKEMRMRGFPPWPEFRRELQCRTYEDGRYR